ncbi:hypothetical protein BU23DRAFT_563646 [Bimuria novae-zelandiae CBS 107.79]|uniref:Uncharacterized protein n=1 Tax=Bimuria novae-zelandiae CBS 107.79 TaxID=1447943 RepID=A0A6A5VNA1_9PLEO|nr:hypothetical protein BU23DRAFT_563646 [Bimuria novae-zelandiae CBS 107.79]
MDHGESIIIKRGNAGLPVHVQYIKLLCIVGRFGREKLKWPSTPKLPRRRSHVPTTPGTPAATWDRFSFSGVPSDEQFNDVYRLSFLTNLTDLTNQSLTFQLDTLRLADIVLLVDGFLPLGTEAHVNILSLQEQNVDGDAVDDFVDYSQYPTYPAPVEESFQPLYPTRPSTPTPTQSWQQASRLNNLT